MLSSSTPRCYERWDPDTPPGLRLPDVDALPPAGNHELDLAEQVEHVELQRFGARRTYTVEQYLARRAGSPPPAAGRPPPRRNRGPGDRISARSDLHIRTSRVLAG